MLALTSPKYLSFGQHLLQQTQTCSSSFRLVFHILLEYDSHWLEVFWRVSLVIGGGGQRFEKRMGSSGLACVWDWGLPHDAVERWGICDIGGVFQDCFRLQHSFTSYNESALCSYNESALCSLSLCMLTQLTELGRTYLPLSKHRIAAAFFGYCYCSTEVVLCSDDPQIHQALLRWEDQQLVLLLTIPWNAQTQDSFQCVTLPAQIRPHKTNGHSQCFSVCVLEHAPEVSVMCWSSLIDEMMWKDFQLQDNCRRKSWPPLKPNTYSVQCCSLQELQM